MENMKKKPVKKKQIKKDLINIDRLEELKDKVIKLFIREDITVFEGRIVINEILKDYDEDVQIDIIEGVLKEKI